MLASCETVFQRAQIINSHTSLSLGLFMDRRAWRTNGEFWLIQNILPGHQAGITNAVSSGALQDTQREQR
jgi:hypothetical protein